MNASDRISRAAELADALAYQEILLNIGADRLRELNKQYDILDREYKLLLSQKRTLTETIIILTDNLDLYSNL
jgi:hypothetical protein